MEGPAAGAEDFPLNGQATVALMVTQEVGRQGWKSTSGCCRCTWCGAALATLIALTVAAAVGYVLFQQVTSNSHTCYPLQWKNSVDYDLFTAETHTNYYIYGWIAFSTGRSETVILRVNAENQDRREFATNNTFMNLVILSANVTLFRGHNVSVHLQSEFKTAMVCAHKLPTN